MIKISRQRLPLTLLDVLLKSVTSEIQEWNVAGISAYLVLQKLT